MTYEAPRDISTITKYIESKELRSYLYTDTESHSIESFLKDNILTKSKLSSNHDHLLLAFGHLSNGEF